MQNCCIKSFKNLFYGLKTIFRLFGCYKNVHQNISLNRRYKNPDNFCIVVDSFLKSFTVICVVKVTQMWVVPCFEFFITGFDTRVQSLLMRSLDSQNSKVIYFL